MTFLAVASAQMSYTCYQGGTQGASECSQFVVDFCNDAAQDVVSIEIDQRMCQSLTAIQHKCVAPCW